MKKNKYVSEDEKRKNFLIIVLIAILFAIMLITMIIPQINKLTQKPEVEEKKSVVKKVEDESTKKEVEKVYRDKSKVTISIEKDTLTSDGAVITIVDENENKYSWSPLYKIQQKIDGKWKDMKLLNPENMMLPDISYDNESGKTEQSLVWGNKYGSLEEGEYRIVKESSDDEFYAEFEIE